MPTRQSPSGREGESPGGETEAPGTRDAAAVKVFPPGVPLATILLGVLLDYLWPIDVGLGVSPSVRYWVGGIVICGSIFGVGLWSVLLFRRAGESEKPWDPTKRIIEHGPYRFTRNPMYLQMILACLGFAILLMNPWILLLTPICWWVLQQLVILPEEEYLERKFGEDYLTYKRRVRRWL